VTKEATLEEVEAGDIAVDIRSTVRRMMKPEKGTRAEMLEGSQEEIADKIIALMKEKGIKK
jgi:electron transfer flavoprotein alpha/beta subunit